MHAEITEENTTIQPQRPKRLLRILEGQSIILRETVTLPVTLRYATLSHCWGSAEDASVWRRTAVADNGVVDIGRAPRILSDTIALLWALDIHYLWVDAICIDQDSQTEWLHESVKMGDIYHHGYLNISAIAFQNGNEGLFHNQPSELKIVLQHQHALGATPVLLAADPAIEWDRQVKGARLSERGWVLQERLLSPRSLHIGKGEVLWECNSLRAGETIAEVKSARPDFKSEFSRLGLCNEWLRTADIWICGHGRGPDAPYRAWESLVQEYSCMNLSKTSDKLVAIAGVANRFARFLELPYTSYMAGHWREDLPRSLLWSVQHGRSFPDRAPSWSWARWDGPIEIFTSHTNPSNLGPSFYTRITATGPEDDIDPFVSVKSRSLSLQGPLTVFNFTDKSKQQPKIERPIGLPMGWPVGRPTAKPTAPFDIPAWILNWDDQSSRTISADQQYYALYICGEPSIFYSTNGLVLIPTGLKRGQFERVGSFKIQVSSDENWSTDYVPVMGEAVLAHCMDPSKIPEDMHTSFDPEYGFEVELV